VLSQPAVSAALVGTLNPVHLSENAAAADMELPPGLVRELDSQLASEEERHRQEVVETLVRLLSGDYSHRNVADVVYIIESALCLGLIPEEEVLPHFYRIWPLRSESSPDPAVITEVLSDLRDLLLASGEGIGVH